MGKRLRLAVAAGVGFALGALIGNFVGLAIRSDNLPFFVALGALVGGGVGFVVALAITSVASSG